MPGGGCVLLGFAGASEGEPPFVQGVMDEDLHDGEQELLVAAQHPQALLTAAPHHTLHPCACSVILMQSGEGKEGLLWGQSRCQAAKGA